MPRNHALRLVLAGVAVLWSAAAVRSDPVPTDAELRRLVADLGSDHFEKREAATRQLSAADESVRPLLRQVLAQTEDVEVRRRLENILAALDVKGRDKDLARALEEINRDG